MTTAIIFRGARTSGVRPLLHVYPKARNSHNKAGLQNGTSLNGSTQINQPNGYSHPKRPPKTTTINKRLSYQTAQDDPAYSYEFPRHNLPYRLSTKTYSHQNGLPTSQKQTTLITSLFSEHTCRAKPSTLFSH